MKHTLLLLMVSIAICNRVYAQQPGWFTDKTLATGLSAETAGHMYIADINEDKYPDIIVHKGSSNPYSRDNIKVYANVQDTASTNPLDRMFVDITAYSDANSNVNLADTGRQSLTLAFADINNDGHVDMISGNYYHRLENYVDVGDRCESFLGDGTGKFTIVQNNGLRALGSINNTGISFLDYNKDGNIDIFLSVWFKDYLNDIWQAPHLMKGNGDGTFTDVSVAAFITTKEPEYGCSVADWNNDGWPDIFTHPYCRTGGMLLKNNQSGAFPNVAGTVGYNAQFMPGDGGQALCMWSNLPEDFDNDGDLDMLFTLVHGGNDPGEGHSTIVMNGGPPNYNLSWALNKIAWANPQSSSRGDYDAVWFDMDNDGLMDICLTQGYYGPTTDKTFFIRQNTSNAFTDVTAALGLLPANAPNLKSTGAIETFDYDLDGDEDLFIGQTINGAAVSLMRNEIGNTKNWVAAELIPPTGVNGSSIGARIYLWSGTYFRMRELNAGRGNFAGQQPFILHFGLDSLTSIDSIQVVWPNNPPCATTVLNPPINQIIPIGPVCGTFGASTPELNNTTNFTVYPNPARDVVIIQDKGGNAQVTSVEVYNIMGQRMSNISIYPNSASNITILNLSALSSGSYSVKGYSKTGEALFNERIAVIK